MNNDIQLINTQIEKLQKENNTLKNEIRALETKITTPEKYCKLGNSSRKLVIYGFGERFGESECDLYNRVIQLFRETYNVNLLGYIEDTQWLGRNNNKKRPLVIELISKRMTKFIIKNSHYLYGTRLAVSEYLDPTELKEKKAMREQMMNARNNGLYAVIRNNQLFIEGKRIDWKFESNYPEKKNTGLVYKQHNYILSKPT